jgi:hypothetical protein
VKAVQLKSKRGRPRANYDGEIGVVYPLSRSMIVAINDGPRAGAGVKVTAECLDCGTFFPTRLSYLRTGKTKCCGCLKKKNYLAYCDRRVAELDDAVIAGIWISRYMGSTREAVAAKFRLDRGIADAAQRVYQRRIDAMISDGKALEILRVASTPVRDYSRTGSAVAAETFGLPQAVVQYLISVGKNKLKAALQTDENAREEARSAVGKAECILELVAERIRMKEYPANELPKEFLRQTLRNEVVGDYRMQYLECRNVNRTLLTSQEIETIDAALAICDRTLRNQRARYEWTKKNAVLIKNNGKQKAIEINYEEAA